MPLYHSLSAKNTPSIRLAKMGSIPTTEDLKYALAEAKKHQKQIELPFKNPDNNLNFAVTVMPGSGVNAPKWEFYREDADGSAYRLWSRESTEVIMIQGKIKIESCYSNAMVQSTSQEDIPAVIVNRDTHTNRPPAPQDSWASGSGSFPAFGTVEHSQSQGQSGSFPSPTNSSTGLKASERAQSASGSWEAPLPAPATINDQAINDTLTAITDSKTGLLTSSAFLLFLLGWCSHAHNKGVNAALIAFDVKLTRDNQAISTKDDEKAFYDWVRSGLKNAVKPYDPITCLEGDEFAALLYGADKASAQKFAAELKENLAATPLPEAFAGCQLDFAAGIFAIATSTREPGRALSAARQAKGMAHDSKFSYFVFPS